MPQTLLSNQRETGYTSGDGSKLPNTKAELNNRIDLDSRVDDIAQPIGLGECNSKQLPYLVSKSTFDKGPHIENIQLRTLHYNVHLHEYKDSQPIVFQVYSSCNAGNCSCSHVIGDCYSQLLPRHLFCEIFLCAR